ncbi:hypothetical protein Acy02nite_60680 [Actinoplanes cyaneus]|uniref:Uncharacterized protein n=1 Tax=Actinoplanes cyaneus TaxID=52696 RepID=A0A919IMY4_9ACTN|nr:hypothetical protein [Actinoplanes cyaneus]MCW2141731.1 hypothetical protein [Actinoplanes cyaneus]GID68187.1 hypothetical protein Acy02nite_60680 [Actinoplanes cyaneus]
MLRVVIRRGFTHDLADMLVEDLRRHVQRLEKPQGTATTSGFHH